MLLKPFPILSSLTGCCSMWLQRRLLTCTTPRCLIQPQLHPCLCGDHLARSSPTPSVSWFSSTAQRQLPKVATPAIRVQVGILTAEVEDKTSHIEQASSVEDALHAAVMAAGREWGPSERQLVCFAHEHIWWAVWRTHVKCTAGCVKGHSSNFILCGCDRLKG